MRKRINSGSVAESPGVRNALRVSAFSSDSVTEPASSVGKTRKGRIGVLSAGEKCEASNSGIWFSLPPKCASAISCSLAPSLPCSLFSCSPSPAPNPKLVSALPASATSAASLPAKSGSIMACASRISCRKLSSAIAARVGMRRFAIAAAVASQVETPVSRASRSTVSSVVLPIPRVGVLTTRCSAIESCGLRTSRR